MHELRVRINLIFLFILISVFFFGCSSERSTREQLKQKPYDTFFELVDYIRENYEKVEDIRVEIYSTLINNLELKKENDAGMTGLWEEIGTDTSWRIDISTGYEKEEKLIEACLQRKDFNYSDFHLEKLDKGFIYDFVGYLELFFDDVDTGDTSSQKQDVVVSLLFAYCEFSDTAPSGWKLVDCKLKTFLSDIEFPKISERIKRTNR